MEANAPLVFGSEYGQRSSVIQSILSPQKRKAAYPVRACRLILSHLRACRTWIWELAGCGLAGWKLGGGTLRDHRALLIHHGELQSQFVARYRSVVLDLHRAVLRFALHGERNL